MIKYYHGTDQYASVLNAIIGDGKLNTGFHMTTDLDTARRYGARVVEIELEEDVSSAHFGRIGTNGTTNAVTNGVNETVLHTPAAVNEFYYNLYDARLVA